MFMLTKVLLRLLALASPLVFATQAWSIEFVNLGFAPAVQSVQVGDIVEIHIIASTDGPSGQEFAAMQAIVEWDPSVLQLLGVDDSQAGYSWFISDFLNDPDGINDDLLDGNAIYDAWAQPGDQAFAPPSPDGLTVTTLQFLALGKTAETVVRYLPSMGAWGETRVLAFGAQDVTGDISSTASVTIVAGCPADLDGDGSVGITDLLVLLATWGTDPVGPPDFDGDGTVGITDLLTLLAAWGPCP